VEAVAEAAVQAVVPADLEALAVLPAASVVVLAAEAVAEAVQVVVKY
jgi:hypothetical protein